MYYIYIAKDYSLVHAAPIVSVFILDYDGIPIPGPYEVEARTVAAPSQRSPHYAVVCTSEQIKVIALPAMKQKRKEKIVDRIQEKIYKVWVIRVKVPAAPVGAARDWNPALAVLTTAGTFLAYSLPDLRMCYRENAIVSSTDQKLVARNYNDIIIDNYVYMYLAIQCSAVFFGVCIWGNFVSSVILRVAKRPSLFLRIVSNKPVKPVSFLNLFFSSSYHSSMLPSLFAYEGSTNPVQLPKKSSLRRRQVVQVEVTSQVSSSRERRSETPSPEDVANGINSSGTKVNQ